MAVHEPNYHQERRDAAYQKIKDNFFSSNSLLLALIMNQPKAFEAATFSEVYQLFHLMAETYPRYFDGVRSYLIPKISNEDECMSVCTLCRFSYKEVTLAIEKHAEFMNARKAKFWEYTNFFTSVLTNLTNRDICKQFPVIAEAWFSSVSSDENLEETLRCCHTVKQEETALRAWYESLFVKPFEELGKDEAKSLREKAISEMKESLIADINSGDSPRYVKLLKYLILEDEIRQFRYLLSDDPYAVTRQSCDNVPFQHYRIGGAVDTEKE